MNAARLRIRPNLLCTTVAAVLLLMSSREGSAQQALSPDGAPVALEYSTDLDVRVSPGGTVLDPGQVLYTEPPDALGGPNPRNGFDFFPGIEAGEEPDAQVDALANQNDALFEDIRANLADLIVSLRPDPATPIDVKAYRERPDGFTAPVWAGAALDADAGAVVEVDALELWGPVGVGGDDARYYSLNGDVTTTSIFYDTAAGGQPYLSQAQVFALLGALFTGTQQQVDVDALMVNDLAPVGTWTAGDGVLISLRAAANLDGGEVFLSVNGGGTGFLVHGGHTWDTAFGVSLAFTGMLGSEEIDALEAAPGGSAVLCAGSPGDGDGDLVCDGQDNCRSVPNAGQGNFDEDVPGDACDACETIPDTGVDSDGDGVDDVCDTCTNVANPQLTGSPGPNRTWISRAPDDDANGTANACDFKYNDTDGLTIVTVADVNRAKGALGKDLSLVTCNAESCGEFDHVQEAPTPLTIVTVAEVNLAKQNLGKSILPALNPAVATCPACLVGSGWSDVIGSGQEELGRPVCQSSLAGACVYAP